MFKKAVEWLIAIFILWGIGVTAGKIYVAYGEYKKNAKATARQELKLDELKRQVSVLQEEVYRLNNDHQYYEQLIRESLGWVKQGEKIFIIQEDKPNTRSKH